MNYFTPDEWKPSELILHIIRTIAFSVPSSNMPENIKKLHLN